MIFVQKPFQDRIVNRIRQFGFKAGITQLIRAVIRVVYQIERELVFVIPRYTGHISSDSRIKPFTAEYIKKYQETGELAKKQINLLLSFITEGSMGLFAEIHGQLAGYAWVQFNGEYRFGKTGRMVIPPYYAISKNLFVFPACRGRKLAQNLNEASLQLIPSNFVPVVFIIPENRPAIRNWEKCGMELALRVTRWRWFFSSWRIDIKRFQESLYVHELEQALIEGHGRQQ